MPITAADAVAQLSPSLRVLLQALDGTLRRLGTDYVDLYQIHWPDR